VSGVALVFCFMVTREETIKGWTILEVSVILAIHTFRKALLRRRNQIPWRATSTAEMYNYILSSY